MTGYMIMTGCMITLSLVLGWSLCDLYNEVTQRILIDEERCEGLVEEDEE